MTSTKLDPKEEQKYKRLRKLGQELHVPIPEHFLTLEVFDKSGKLIQKHHQRSHSWVRNAYNLLLSQMAATIMKDAAFGAGLTSIKDTGGVVRDANKGATISAAADFETDDNGYRAIAANTLLGIIVGSGLNAEDFEDFELQTLILEGSVAGKLSYTATVRPTQSYAAGPKIFTITWHRYMNNNSGGAIDVNEVGLVAAGTCDGNNKWMMSRDHLVATVTVPDTGQLLVTYTIELTYPA